MVVLVDKKDYIPRHADKEDTIEIYNSVITQYIKEMKDKEIEEAKRKEEDSKKSTEERVKQLYSEDNNVKKKKIVTKKKKKRRIKAWVWTFFIIVFLGIILYSLYRIISWKKDNLETSNIINNITEDVEVEEKEDTNAVLASEPSSSDYWFYINYPFIDADINKLKGKNPDTVGFINVNNTNINYPVVQTTDNDYYLTHSYDKSYNEAGWVFLDYRNNSDFNNKNSIIYAHSRLDKTMFGSLSKVFKNSWYTNKENHIIRLSTEKENTLWEIFSVYKIKEESYYITTDFRSDTEYTNFLNTMKGRSIYDFDVSVKASDKILTLSTCYSDTERTVVHAKLIKVSTKEE